MTQVAAIGTYLPPWTSGGRRVRGPDEDALTMAVAAGRAADPGAHSRRVILVSRDFPLLEGGNAAVLLAGLSLSGDTPVAEVLGGAPAVLDQLLAAGPDTLVIAADDNVGFAGAAAVLTGGGGPTLTAVDRQTRSLPLVARTNGGSRHAYADPRLQREVGVRDTLALLRLDDDKAVVAMVGAKPDLLAAQLNTSSTVTEVTSSASALIRVLAAVLETNVSGLVVAVEQATVGVVDVATSETPARITRDEADPRELPKTKIAEGIGIPISLPAYARAFEPKIRWEAAIFDERPGIDGAPQFPPRARVDEAGVLAGDYRLEPLPRTGTVYTHTTIRIPVPDLPSPYSIAVVALDDSPVRVLLKVTGVPAGEAAIGQAGSVVLRRIATRTGIPDYGYAFWPGRTQDGIAG